MVEEHSSDAHLKRCLSVPQWNIIGSLALLQALCDTSSVIHCIQYSLFKTVCWHSKRPAMEGLSVTVINVINVQLIVYTGPDCKIPKDLLVSIYKYP